MAYNNDLPKLAKNSKKGLNYKISLFMMIFTIMLISSVATYAFFTSETKETKEKFTLKTGTMELEFSDNDNGIDAKLFFGDSVTKKFTITNTGTLESSMGIDFYRYKNTYIEGSLTYKIEYSENEDGPYTEILPEKELVVTDEEIKIIPAIETITIPAGKTYYYNLTVKYNDLEIDQTSDSKAIFYTRFSVKDQDPEPDNSMSTYLMKKANSIDVTNYEQGNKQEMYTFNHEVTEQTGDLTDYRYIGKTPNNYIEFNNETWRIIGVFDVENSKGKTEKRVKIMRDESIGAMSWKEENINEWVDSDLKNLLNTGDYFKRVGSYSSMGLNEKARTQISDVKWYLGGASTHATLSGEDYYKAERSLQTFDETRSKNVIQTVGLMYASDYSYTFSKGINDSCYNNGYTCYYYTNSWIYNNIYPSQWTMTIFSYDKYFAACIPSGRVDFCSVSSSSNRQVRPVVFLNPDLEIESGDGSLENKYIIK